MVNLCNIEFHTSNAFDVAKMASKDGLTTLRPFQQHFSCTRTVKGSVLPYLSGYKTGVLSL